MRIAIMQPYILPYIGYFQLISSADVFVLYDEVKYTKKGWINRNRFLLNGKAEVFTVPLVKGLDSAMINKKSITPDYDGQSVLRRLEAAYFKAPQFKEAFELAEKCLAQDEKNLFRYLNTSIRAVCDYLKIPTKIVISSEVESHPERHGQDRVISLCKDLKATTYINSIGGEELYAGSQFKKNGLDLVFLSPDITTYGQFQGAFTPRLSIIDVLMFLAREKAASAAKKYDLIGSNDEGAQTD